MSVDVFFMHPKQRRPWARPLPDDPLAQALISGALDLKVRRFPKTLRNELAVHARKFRGTAEYKRLRKTGYTGAHIILYLHLEPRSKTEATT